MVHASLLKPICQIGFLFQYYILLAFVLINNLFKKTYNFIKNKQEQLHWHPFHSVHPHVFAHSHVLIGHQNYTFQIYQSQTQDHAFVTLWRIRLQDQSKWNHQNPILIQHGLLDCGMSWFLHEDKNQSLPFVLASQGYDVWVGNNRGTKYSNKNSHIKGYWQFNIDHFAKYDQPTLINTVLKQTNKQKLIYIGHSQGSTQFLLGLGENIQLQHKIQRFFGMGAVISLQNLKDHRLLQTLSKLYLVQILQYLGFNSILILPQWMHSRIGILVYNFSFYVNIILNFITFLCGKTSRNNIDTSRLGILVTHQPGGTSVQSVKHWIQTYRNKKLTKYDYGRNKNIQIYGTPTPPQYQFNHIKQFQFKSYIFRGLKDAVICDQDFNVLIKHFNPNKIQVHQIHDYAHLDYAWGINAKQQIYDKIVDILKKQRKLSTQNSQKQNCSTQQETSLSSKQDLLEQIDC